MKIYASFLKMSTQNHLQFLVFLGFILFFVSSCSPGIYSPNAINVPTLKEKGDLSVSLSTTLRPPLLSGDNSNQIPFAHNLQSSFAITKNIGIVANGMIENYNSNYNNYSNSTGSKSFTGNHDESFWEIGAGYFDKFKNVSYLKWNIFAGFGMGNSTLKNTADNSMVFKSPYSRVFIQPSIGIFKENFEASYAMRGSYVSVGNIDWADNTSLNGKTISGFLLEPCLTLSAGFKNAKIFWQNSGMSSGSELNKVIDFNTIYSKSQIGVNFSFNLSKRSENR